MHKQNRDIRMMTNVETKIKQGRRLDFADALSLFVSYDLLQLGRLAESVTLDKFGPQVFYCINRHINYSNVCRMDCEFCQFRRRYSDNDSFSMTPAEIAQLAKTSQINGATEIHLVGSINPDLSYSYYIETLKNIKRVCPKLHVKAFTAVEIIHIAKLANMPVREALIELRNAGLDSMPGGGAEILSDDYFAQHCKAKFGPKKWLQVHRTAHDLDINTNATMLFGYQETLAQRVKHLLTLRKLQDESLAARKTAFQCFVPLPWINPDQSLPNASDQLKTIAISRLVLDNFKHVKAFWPMLGVGPAQIALSFGANDLDGTVQQYQIATAEKENSATNITEDRIQQLIIEAGKTPLKRTPSYQPQ